MAAAVAGQGGPPACGSGSPARSPHPVCPPSTARRPLAAPPRGRPGRRSPPPAVSATARWPGVTPAFPRQRLMAARRSRSAGTGRPAGRRSRPATGCAGPLGGRRWTGSGAGSPGPTPPCRRVPGCRRRWQSARVAPGYRPSLPVRPAGRRVRARYARGAPARVRAWCPSPGRRSSRNG